MQIPYKHKKTKRAVIYPKDVQLRTGTLSARTLLKQRNQKALSKRKTPIPNRK